MFVGELLVTSITHLNKFYTRPCCSCRTTI